MESNENNPLISKKYTDLSGSHEVERAVKTLRSEGETVPEKKDARIGAYFLRLDRIVKSERGLELLEHKIQKEFVLDLEGEDGDEGMSRKEKLAHGLFESEKKIARERGQGAQVDGLGDTLSPEQYAIYEKALYEKQDEQKQTLSEWLDYLGDKDTDYMPMWFKYFTMRSLEKMGTRNKETAEYTKRTGTTLHPFPELDREALARVLDEIVASQEAKPVNEEKNDEQKNLEQLIGRGDFAKLYARFQSETEAARLERREGIEGQWMKYDQGTDAQPLYESLSGKGTGWCTAGSETARNQLSNGDFYVYYTLDSNGAYSNPRIAIRMENDEVAEVRGIGKNQELEPLLIDTAREQYKNLPGGEKYEKKASDMKQLTVIETKAKSGEMLTKKDLQFLYEIDGTIEGFGYQKDPRIEELRAERSIQEDLPVLFDCSPEDIAASVSEITETTKVFAGKIDSYNLSNLSYEELKTVVRHPDLRLFDMKDLKIVRLEHALPQSIDYGALKVTDKSRVGEIYVNPESVAVDWEKVNLEKIKSFDFSEFVGKPRSALAQHIAKEYGDKYIVPDLTCREFLMNNPEKIPSFMKDGNYYYFMGSVLRYSNGHADLPRVRWNGDELNRNDGWLGSEWNGNGRVVLLER